MASNFRNAIAPQCSGFFKDFIITALHEKIGLKREKIELLEIISSRGNENGDRFRLSIPYAGQTLNWLVIFNSSSPTMSPDFDFSDKGFMADPELKYLNQHVPSWNNWDPEDRKSLFKVLIELIECYKKFQIERLPNKLEMEHGMLLHHSDIKDQDVEIFLSPNVTRPTEIHFSIRIAMDFSQIPGRLGLEDNDAVLLHIIFSGTMMAQITAELFLSTSLQDVIGDPKNFHSPSLLLIEHLLEYVSKLKQLINEKIKSIIENFNMKKSFIAAVVGGRSGSVVEFDAFEFSKITLLFNHNDFHFLLHIILSSKFPQEPPEYVMQSIYHFSSNGELCKLSMSGVGHSPRWTPLKMLNKACERLFEGEIQRFKQLCLRFSFRHL